MTNIYLPVILVLLSEEVRKISIQNYSEEEREKNKKSNIEGFPFEVEEIYDNYIDIDKILNAEVELYKVFKPYEIDQDYIGEKER